MKDRVSELDGFRAVAILSVIAFHYTLRFPGFYPYEPTQVFQYGYLGVHLFFIISGFVIAMTLFNSRSATEFAVRRWSRLAPPMLVCSIATFLFLALVSNPFTDMRRGHVYDFLPSWTFTQPGIFEWLFPDIQYVDGVYWSLFFEVRFYFWAALLFFGLGQQRFVASFVAFTAFSLAGFLLAECVSPATGLAFSTLFISKYIALFCAGVLFYELRESGKPWVVAAILACWVASMQDQADWTAALLLSLCFALFFILVYRRAWLTPFTSRPATWIGLVSYSLYLLHENIGVGLMNEFPALGRAAPFMAAGVVIGGASAVYLLVERRSGALARYILAWRGRAPSLMQNT